MIDSTNLTAEILAKAAVILSVGILLLFSSLISIYVTICNDALQDIIGYYMLSLSIVDLLCSIIIVPTSMYSALVPEWQFMGDNSLFCKCSVYVEVALFANTAYTFAWIGVDRYAALMKPQRYEAKQTVTRCKCWIAFSWLTALLLSLPIIVARMRVSFYAPAELCILDWSATVAYSTTLAILILLPSVSTVLFTYCSVLKAVKNFKKLEDTQRTILETDHSFAVAFFILITFCLSWLPVIIVKALPKSLLSPADSETVEFVFIWLAIGGPSSKLLISLFINQEFRSGLASMCSCIFPCCCVNTSRQRRLEYRNFSEHGNHLT